MKLPKRELGEMCKFGWLVIGAGVVGAIFMFVWISLPLSGAVNAFAKKEWLFGLGLTAFASFGIAGLNYVKNILIAGYGIIRDRTSVSIVWKNEKLAVIEHLSGFKWRRRCKLKKIGRLVFEKPESKENELFPKLSEELETLSAYEADDEKKSFVVALGYPREILEQVANELSELMETARLYQSANVEEIESTIRQTYAEITQAEIESRSEKGVTMPRRLEIVDKSEYDRRPKLRPENCRIEFEQHEGAIVFFLEPKGFFAGSNGLGVFAIIWNVILLIISISMLIQYLGGGESIWLLLGLAPFWIIGAATTWLAWQHGKLGVTLGVSKHGIWYNRNNLLGKETVNEIASKNIQKIVYANTADEGEYHTLLIYQTDGSVTSLFGGSTEDEIRWMAYEINKELALDSESPRELDWHQLRVQTATTPDLTRSGMELTEEGKHRELLVLPDRWTRLLPALIIMALLIVGGCIAIFFAIRDQKEILIMVGCALIGIGLVGTTIGTVFSRRTYRFKLNKKQLEFHRTGIFGELNLVFNRDDLSITLPQASDATRGIKDVYYIQMSSGILKKKMLWCRNSKDVVFVAATLNVWLMEPLV